jgi:DNA-3-methyladenine glycosylase II
MNSVNRYQASSEFLANLDADWACLVNTLGPCTFEAKPAREPYETLIRSIAYQQLHAKAGDAIISRLLAVYGVAFPSPQQLFATEFEVLRQCGFSARKIATIQAIAAGATNGLMPSWHEAELMSDEDLITRLVTVKGIGRWTVEMLLMFSLQRMDILPANDFAIAAGYQRLKNLPLPPKPKQLAAIGKQWSPHRTVASWYLWRVPKESANHRHPQKDSSAPNL